MRLSVVGFMLCLAACGGDDSACESAFTRLCERSCECQSSDARCHLVSNTGVTIHFDNEADCLQLYVTYGCSQDSSVDYDACEAAVEAAQCTSAPASSDVGIEFPDACKE